MSKSEKLTSWSKPWTFMKNQNKQILPLLRARLWNTDRPHVVCNHPRHMFERTLVSLLPFCRFREPSVWNLHDSRSKGICTKQCQQEIRLWLLKDYNRTRQTDCALMSVDGLTHAMRTWSFAQCRAQMCMRSRWRRKSNFYTAWCSLSVAVVWYTVQCEGNLSFSICSTTGFSRVLISFCFILMPARLLAQCDVASQRRVGWRE